MTRRPYPRVYTDPMNDAIRPEIAFVGGGNMASALVGGLLKGGRIPATVLMIEPDDRQRARLALQFGVLALPAADGHLDGVPLVVWAVKPQSFAAAVRPCAPFVGDPGGERRRPRRRRGRARAER